MELVKFRPQGVIMDLPAQQVPPDKYTISANIDFAEGSAERQPGARLVETPATHLAYKLLYAWNDSGDFFLYPGPEAISVWDGSAHHAITPAGFPAGLPAGGWTVLTFNQIPILNHPGLSPPVWWDRVTANPCQDLPAWPSGWSTKVMRPFKNFILALGRRETGQDYDDQLVSWSDAAPAGSLPGEWIASATNLAGDFVLSDAGGTIVEGVQLRDGFIIYKEASTYLMEFIGGSAVMNNRKLFETSGALAEGCVAEFKGNHFVVTDGSIIVHDGIRIEEIGSNRIRRFFFQDLNSQFYTRAFCRHDRRQRQIHIVYPDVQSDGWCNKTLTWSYVDDTWTTSILPAQSEVNKDYITDVTYGRYTLEGLNLDWDSDTEAWNDDKAAWNYIGQSAGRLDGLAGIAGTKNSLAQLGKSDLYLGETVPFLLEKIGIDLDNTDRLKYVSRLWPRFAPGVSDEPLIFQVGRQETLASAPVWGPEREFTPGVDSYVPVDAYGRAFAVRMKEKSATNNDGWRLVGFDFDFRAAGRY